MTTLNKVLPLSIFAFLTLLSTYAQTAAAEDILSKSIEYHDPDGKWGSFKGSFTVELTTPGKEPRLSEINMDQTNSRFLLRMTQGSNTRTFETDKDQCRLTFNGNPDFSEEVAEEHGLTCERARMYRDYYSYLYGLPMKLRDPGTQLSPEVQKKSFKGKEYLVLKVTYEAEVGKDTWYFYFDPKTYAMEVYQFFHNEAENDGEYILLEGIFEVDGMRLPKRRTWYTNKEDKLLGTDTLKNL